MVLSVIIVNWNTKDLTSQAIDSIYKYTKDVESEVILVDNASTDKSVEVIRKKFPKVKIIENRQNVGFGNANNQGMKIAKGDYFFLFNSDAYLIENSFKKLIDHAKDLPDLGLLGPLLLNENRTIQQSVGFFPNLPQVFWWMSFIDDLPGGTRLKPYHVDHDSFYKEEQKVDWITGAGMFLPKAVFQKIGGFDKNIFMYGEDWEWCYRVKKVGYQVYFSPVTKMVHIGQGSSNKIPINAFIGEYKAIIFFYKKYKSNLSLQIVRLLLKIGALARVVIFGTLGVILNQPRRKELAKYYGEVYKVA